MQQKISKIPSNQSNQPNDPNPQQWQAFIDKTLLWLGLLALVFSLLFFIAYNWFEMGKWGKFILVQSGLVMSVLAYLFYTPKTQPEIMGNIDSIDGDMSNDETYQKPQQSIDSSTSKKALYHSYQPLLLLTISILMGILLALFGQVYQTGADPWQLFATWAVFMMPLAYVSRSAVLWLLFVGLVNVSVSLYGGLSSRFILFDTVLRHKGLWLHVLVNAVFFMVWYALKQRGHSLHQKSASETTWLDSGWLRYPLALCSLLFVMLLTCFNILDSNVWMQLLTTFIFSAWVWYLFYLYRIKQLDLGILSLCACACICVITTTFVEMISLRGAGDFLLIAMIIIAQSTFAVGYLRSLEI